MVEHLPPGGPVERELGSIWNDDTRILHSIDSSMRRANALFFNAYKGKDQQAETPEYLPTPETRLSPEQEAEQAAYEGRQRDELQAVLNRPNPH